jgi:FkbM family methyltransferase
MLSKGFKFKMSISSQKITASRLSRIPKRISQDWQILNVVKNWREVLSSKVSGKPLNLIEFRNGAKLESPAEIDLQFLFQEVWVDQIYTPAGYEIKDGDTILDIGANIGVFAIYAATRAEETTVLAFEPFPENVKFLRKNISKSSIDNIKVFQQAVASNSEERVLEVSDSWIKHSLGNLDSDQKGIRIQSVSFDEVMKKIKKCDLLKIDCEGSEYEIFYSASSESLAKVNKIVGEFHNRNEDVMNGKTLCKFLETQGFRLTHIEGLNEESGYFCATKNS